MEQNSQDLLLAQQVLDPQEHLDDWSDNLVDNPLSKEPDGNNNISDGEAM